MSARHAEARTATGQRLPLLFAGAVALRWAYSMAMFAAMGEDGLLGMDSRGYLSAIREFAGRVAAGSVHGWQFVSTSDFSLAPLAPWAWTSSVLVFGDHAALAFVLFQGMLDGATCLLVFGMAYSLDRRIAWPAAIAAALNPTQIVMAGLFYTDTLFLFFVACSLYAALRWLKGLSLPWAAALGLGLGCAALTRMLIVPWAALLLAYLLVIACLRRKEWTALAGQLCAGGLILAVCLAPVIARNVFQYHTFAITAQAGAHSVYWIAPLVRQAKDGTPWTQGAEDMKQLVKERGADTDDNPFKQSRRLEAIGRDAIRELGLSAVVKAWTFGAAINLGAPALLLSPPVQNLPRTGFYDTPGTSMPGKIMNFMFRSDNALYAWLLIGGIVGVVIFRLLQLAGAVILLRSGADMAAFILLASWIGYIVLLNGPVASPKYRLPIEPPLMVLAGAGIAGLRSGSSRLKTG